jgi:hypothetical protein
MIIPRHLSEKHKNSKKDVENMKASKNATKNFSNHTLVFPIDFKKPLEFFYNGYPRA